MSRILSRANLTPKLTRRHFLQASAFTVAGGLIAACAPTAAPTTSGGEAAPAGEVVELSYFTPDRELGKNVAEYEIETFNAKMEAESKPYRMVLMVGPATDNDIKTKLTLDAAAGTLPDYFSSRSELVADFIAANYVAEITDQLTAWDGWAHIPDSLKTLATFDSKLYGVPGGTTFTFFRRKDVMDAAGIAGDQPNTWDDFYAACDAIATQTEAMPTGLPAATPWGGGTWGEAFQMVWLGFDGTIYDESDNKWVVASPNLLKAFQVYETLASNGWLTVDMLLTPNPWEPIKYQGFPSGEVVLVTGGDWQWTFDWGPDGATPIEGLYEKVDRWQWPAESGTPFTYVSGGVGNMIAANTKSLDGVVEFILFQNEPAVMCETVDLYIGGPASRTDLAEQCPAYAEAVNGKMAEASQLFESGLTYKFDRVGANRIADGVARATEDIITGVVTAEEAMEAFAAAVIQDLGDEGAKRA
jgi:multiple sugar transport system substrate-binding protein